MNHSRITTYLTGLLWFSISDIKDKLDRIKVAYTHVHPLDPNNVFETYLIKNEKIGVPYGNQEKIHSIVGEFTVVDKRLTVPFDTSKVSKLKLRDYQEVAMQEIKALLTNGKTEFNLAGKPGSGKSFMLSNLLAELNLKTLIIANQKMLINQLSTEIENTLGCKANVLSSSNTVLGDINVATSQFISQNPDVWYAIKEQVSVLVLDEAEALASPTVTRIFQRSPAKYKIYISATFSRSVDHRTEALMDFAGKDKVILHSTGNIIPTVLMVQCPERFIAPSDAAVYVKAKGRFFMYQGIHNKVQQIVQYSVNKNRQVLIGCDVQKVQKALQDKLTAIGIRTEILNGSTKEKDRLRILQEYSDGLVKVLIGFGVLNAGISIPKIQTIIRLSMPSSIEKLEQFIGRGVRSFEGKEGCYVIDLVFEGFNLAPRNTLYQLKARTEKWKVYKTTWEQFSRTLN